MPDFSKDFPVIEVDRVIDGSDVKTFSVKGVLAFLDSPSLDFTGTNIYLDNPVPVLGVSESQVGYASVSLRESGAGSLLADVFLRYDSEERLLIETGENLYLKVNGRMFLAEAVQKGSLDMYAHKTPVLSIYVDSISLSRTSSSDSRIPPIGKEVL